MMLNLQLTELSAVGTEYTQNLPLGTIIGSRANKKENIFYRRPI